MKKTLLTSTLLLLFPLLGFGISDESLCYWKSEMGTTQITDPLDGWTCRGSGKTAKDINIGESGVNLRNIFPEGGPAYVPVNFEDFGIIYVSNSSTEEGGKADEWLISPEIDLSGAPENMVLSFDVFTYGNSNDALFGVYASPTGSDNPEAFTTKIYSGKTENGASEPKYKRLYLPVSGISGGKVRIAFVNTSRNAMLLGFKNAELCEYQLDVRNNLNSYYQSPQDLTVTLDVDMRTPVPCDGFTAVLKTADGNEQEFVSNRPVGSAYTHVVVNFPEKLEVNEGDDFNYTVSITPNYEGASKSVFEYSIVCNNGFESVCVLEELTGTWCMWCPRGAAALGYFSDKYKDRFIGIAVHSDDPMALDRYISPLKTQSGLSTYPNGWFNREVSEDPFTPAVVENILSQRSGYSVAIKEVCYNETTDRTMTVKYAPKVAFDSKSQNITAAVVVTEDNVKGYDPNWNQKNGYSGSTKAGVEDVFGEGTWPFFQKYAEGKSTILFRNMVYDHVATGIWNTYLGGGAGATLPREWEANTEQEFTISFELPQRASADDKEGVQNWKNTHVVVLLLDSDSGKILSAAKMGADEYNAGSSVEEIGGVAEVSVKRCGRSVVVESPVSAEINLYNINGFKLISKNIEAGTTSVDTGNLSGMVIVKVSEGNNTYVKKLIL